MLYLIEILHQTTTTRSLSWLLPRCILSKFYIKPQLCIQCESILLSCILSKFYIKPQHTSATTSGSSRCILSKFYIKPQLSRQWLMVPCVVSYRNSTSNHNLGKRLVKILQLYLIEILHQTTTSSSSIIRRYMLYLIEILHQTTTSGLILIDKVLLTGCLPL